MAAPWLITLRKQVASESDLPRNARGSLTGGLFLASAGSVEPFLISAIMALRPSCAGGVSFSPPGKNCQAATPTTANRMIPNIAGTHAACADDEPCLRQPLLA